MKKIILGCLLLGYLSLSAQISPADILYYSKSAKALKRKGDKACQENDFMLAQLYYEKLVKLKPSKQDYQFELGKILLKNKLNPEAEKVLAGLTNYSNSVFLYLACAQVELGKYALAKKNFATYKMNPKALEEKPLQTRLKVFFKKEIYQQKDSQNALLVIRLSKKVNGKLAEFTPLYLTDSTFLFGKTTPDETRFYLKTDTLNNLLPTRKLFVGKIDETGAVASLQPFQIVPTDSAQNYGGACFNTDKTSLYFTQCDRKLNELICHIYQTKKTVSGWEKPTLLGGKINGVGFSSAQPTLQFDKQNRIVALYFASNRTSENNFDIYYAVFDSIKKQFSSVSKCGTLINSAENEWTPFYSSNDSILYFSTKGKGGYGGQDIFKSKGSLNQWSEPEPLPKPINSAADEAYFSIYPNQEKGFFTSNRNSESAKEIKTCCDDIYAFYKSPQPMLVKDTTVVSSLSKLISIPVQWVFENGVQDTFKSQLTVHEKAPEGFKIIHQTNLQQLDTTLLLTAHKEYKLTVSHPQYLTASKEIFTTGNERQDTVRLAISSIPKKAIVIPGIQYEFDSSRLIPVSIQKIDSFIYPLLVDNPTLIFQLNSHTDSKGDAIYNQKLSENRAKSVVEYLTKTKSIAPQRLRYKGFGESKPIAPNTLPDGTDNPAGRALNRRTEFEVVGGVGELLK